MDTAATASRPSGRSPCSTNDCKGGGSASLRRIGVFAGRSRFCAPTSRGRADRSCDWRGAGVVRPCLRTGGAICRRPDVLSTRVGGWRRRVARCAGPRAPGCGPGGRLRVVGCRSLRSGLDADERPGWYNRGRRAPGARHRQSRRVGIRDPRRGRSGRGGPGTGREEPHPRVHRQNRRDRAPGRASLRRPRRRHPPAPPDGTIWTRRRDPTPRALDRGPDLFGGSILSATWRGAPSVPTGAMASPACWEASCRPRR